MSKRDMKKVIHVPYPRSPYFGDRSQPGVWIKGLIRILKIAKV